MFGLELQNMLCCDIEILHDAFQIGHNNGGAQAVDKIFIIEFQEGQFMLDTTVDLCHACGVLHVVDIDLAQFGETLLRHFYEEKMWFSLGGSSESLWFHKKRKRKLTFGTILKPCCFHLWALRRNKNTLRK